MLFAEVISIENDVVEVFHFEILAVDNESRAVVKSWNCTSSVAVGGGRTGPGGGHLAASVAVAAKAIAR